MPRKLKVYRTSLGFFDLAVAAPSMKAAIEAWGANPDIFRSGFAEETDDPKIVKATMARPGVVLKRPVGSNDEFGETAELPRASIEKNERTKSSSKADDKHQDEERQAKERRDAERQRAEMKRLKLVASADATLERARTRHDNAVAKLAQRRQELERAEKDEAETWNKDQRDHKAAVEQASSQAEALAKGRL